jgi:hypothetical protein
MVWFPVILACGSFATGYLSRLLSRVRLFKRTRLRYMNRGGLSRSVMQTGRDSSSFMMTSYGERGLISVPVWRDAPCCETNL